MFKGSGSWLSFVVAWLAVVAVLASLIVGWVTKQVVPEGCASAVRYVSYLRTEGEGARREHLFNVAVLSTSKTVEFVARVPVSLMPRLPSNQPEACRALGLGE